ncbi:MAG: tRNA pseudouridine(55) synthase TruB [Chloroflexota bacterium]
MAHRSLGPGLDGVLVVAKPAGPTSHDIVALVRRLAQTKRVGHGGTLDPFAGGVLPLFLGRATRLAEFHLGADKTYRATVCFGASSTTDDLEGELTPADGPPVERALVDAALARFRGPIRQRPPDFSAIKVGGRRAYALARAGEAVELREREVTIHRAEIASWDGTDAARPIAVIEISCSAGTYVRALARDLGSAVGSAAYLGALTRTASGPFELDGALTLEALRDAAADGPAGLTRVLRPIDAGLDHVPTVTVDAAAVADLAKGRFIKDPGASAPVGGHAGDGLIRVVDAQGRLVALARIRDGRLAPDKVFVDPQPQPVG